MLKQSGGERIEFVAVFRISDADDIRRDFVIVESAGEVAAARVTQPFGEPDIQLVSS